MKKTFNDELESKIMRNGLKATIIKYHGDGNVDIAFESGVIKHNVSYRAFKSGTFSDGITPYKFPENKYKKEERLGEVRIMNCGIEAKIIEYVNTNNITIQFLNDNSTKKCTYDNFKKGVIKPKNYVKENPRIGETRVMNNGMKATIINYQKNTNMDVQFEDGYIKKSVAYKSFLAGNIRNPNIKGRNVHKKNRNINPRLGETKIMNNGMKATIIAYRGANDIDIQFDDGYVKRGIAYQSFLVGSIRNPNTKIQSTNKARKRFGEQCILEDGRKAIIIAYRNISDIDVQFEDGTVINTDYESFHRGFKSTLSERLRKERLGETRTMNNGMKATIIAYRGSNDIDVQFEDGVIKKNREYSQFINGSIGNNKKDSRLGESRIMNNGKKATIIKYNNACDIDVKFEDGYVQKHTLYYNFENGLLSGRKIKKVGKLELYKLQRIGEIGYLKDGTKAVIIEYRKASDIDIRLEDGTIIRHCTYVNFINKRIDKDNRAIRTTINHEDYTKFRDILEFQGKFKDRDLVIEELIKQYAQ